MLNTHQKSNNQNNSVFLAKEKKNSAPSDLSATSPMPASEIQREIDALIHEDKFKKSNSNQNLPSIPKMTNSNQNNQYFKNNYDLPQIPSAQQPNFSYNKMINPQNYNTQYSAQSYNTPYSAQNSAQNSAQYSAQSYNTPYSAQNYNNTPYGAQSYNLSKQSGGASRNISRSKSRPSETYDENDITAETMSRSSDNNTGNISSASDSMYNSNNYNKSKKMVMNRSTNLQYNDTSNNSQTYNDEDESERMARTTYSDNSNSNYEDFQDDEFTESSMDREQGRNNGKMSRTLPDAIKKRHAFREFLKDNGITGGLEINSLLEKYIDESGVDKKKNLDEAIKRAKEKMLDDKKKGVLEKRMLKIKEEMKARREAKKNNKK